MQELEVVVGQVAVLAATVGTGLWHVVKVQMLNIASFGLSRRDLMHHDTTTASLIWRGHHFRGGRAPAGDISYGVVFITAFAEQEVRAAEGRLRVAFSQVVATPLDLTSAVNPHEHDEAEGERGANANADQNQLIRA